jgi:glycosyltransferase involved in cell wall biosynthesis
MDKSLCRKKLLIPSSKFVLLNVSFSSSNKKLDFLGEIMDTLSDEYLLIHIGNTNVVCNNPDRILNINQYLDNQLLVKYYNSADLYLAPSTSEGFNYPITEALNCEIPVLASDIELFREVLMNSPYLIPLNIVEWRDAIISLTDKKALKDAIEWYILKIGDYYREKRGKTEFMEFYNSLGVKV